MKKGSTLIGELIAFFFLIVLGYFMGGMIIYTHMLAQAAHVTINYDLTIESTSIPIKHELALMSFLESTYDICSGRKVPMKELITAAAVQNLSEVYIDGCIVNVSQASQGIFDASGWTTDRGFLLQLKKSDKNIRLAWDITQFKGSTTILRLQRISTKVISPFVDGTLELTVR